MKPQVTEEQLQKLPKWANELIRTLGRERGVAIQKLHQFIDTQSPSCFYHDDLTCTGEQQGPSIYKHFVQTCRIVVEHKGVRLEVVALDKDNITLRWDTPDRASSHVALIPISFQSAELVTKENMR